MRIQIIQHIPQNSATSDLLLGKFALAEALGMAARGTPAGRIERQTQTGLKPRILAWRGEPELGLFVSSYDF